MQAYRDECLWFSPEQPYGSAIPKFNVKLVCKTARTQQLIRSRKRPDLSFDVDIFKFVSQLESHLVFSVIKTASLASMLFDFRFQHWRCYKLIYKVVQETSASTRAKVCLLTNVRYFLRWYNKDQYFNKSLVNHWVRTYVHAFDHPIATVHNYALQPFAKTDASESPDKPIMCEYVQVLQANSIFLDWVLQHSEQHLVRATIRTSTPTFSFTTNQLISTVMSASQVGDARLVLTGLKPDSPKAIFKCWALL